MMEKVKPLVSRNFDSHAYREKLAKIPSHYSQYNNSKNEIFSVSMSNCHPPYSVFVSHRIIKEIQNSTGTKEGGINTSYYYRKYRGPKYNANDITSALVNEIDPSSVEKSGVFGNNEIEDLINEIDWR